ncbi:hypothetical protein [Antarctobacter heliothermus]|uniref:Uncharacterized protein n=1 Tax=Antarctobacter heliothermus TaxID=74033 RepID=A0A239AN92_9RHOB|nr:hypothetical protein [Antarctobacter heliothermus]SNR96782.1 hypothetical protein SAMN04488078_100111 [Antarctobacter heliothermus]
MRRGLGMGLLALAGIMMLVGGVGLQEPALAAGPLYDPTLIHGIDVEMAMQVRDCEPSLFATRHCNLWGHWRPL